MFDTHIHEHRKTEYTTVHEHRAPTDQSVALLKEMERAAMEKVVKSIRLENTVVDGVIHKHEDIMNDRLLFLCHVKVNGRMVEVRTDFPRDASLDEVASGLADATARQIACELLNKAFKASMVKP